MFNISTSIERFSLYNMMPHTEIMTELKDPIISHQQTLNALTTLIYSRNTYD